jgi:hypothetical protein
MRRQWDKDRADPMQRRRQATDLKGSLAITTAALLLVSDSRTSAVRDC